VVVRTTRFATGASDVAPKGGVRFYGEIVITVSSFAFGAWTTSLTTATKFVLFWRVGQKLQRIGCKLRV